MKINYSREEMEALKGLFNSSQWEILIRPFKEHVENLANVIVENEEISEEERKGYMRVCKIYKELVNLPQKLFKEEESVPKMSEFDPYEKS